MDDRDTLTFLVAECAVAFEPLAAAMLTPEAYRDYVADLGWEFDTVPTALDELKPAINDVTSMVAGGALDDSQVPTLIGKLLFAFTAIADLRNGSGLDPAFQSEFPRQLVDFIFVEHLLSQQARWGTLLLTLGLVRLEEVPPSSTRPGFLRRVLAVEDINPFLSDPLGYLKTGYAWGQSSFDGDRLFQNLEAFLVAWGLDAREQLVDPVALGQLQAGALVPDDTYDVSLRLVFIEHQLDPETFSAGAAMYLLPETSTEKPGFSILPFTSPGFDQSVELSDTVTLEFQGGIDLSTGVGALVRPNEDIRFVTGLEAGAPSPVTGNLAISLRLGQPGSPILIVGHPDGSRLEFGGVTTTLGTRLGAASKLDVFAEFALQGGKIVIQPASGEADGFLASLLPSNGFEADFDLTVGFSTARGLYIGGSGGFVITLPVHLQVGPISVLTVMLAVRFNSGGIPIDLAASVKGSLGSAVVTTVENIGLTADFTFPPDKKGNLGAANLALTFKHPTGLGLDIDAGAVTGGGFLSFDDTIGRYSGAIELSVYSIAVKAFGLVDTVFPDGSKGFSFVIIISAEFIPIQLGFGFTLIGVGGLIGINRGLNSDGLSKGVRSGSLDHLLFPRNPVQDAPAIINDLATIFPATKGQDVFGPMGKLGWGTPTLISAELGIVLQLPGPRLALLGIVQMALPTSKAALLSIHVAIAGVLDFPKRLLAFDASIYDSKVAGFNLSGDIAFRLTWGSNSNFALAVGGFNPVYQPPPGFPTLKRVSVDAGINGNPRLTISGYFALTSNTAQVGAALDLHASGFGIDLDGHLGFDALFVFSPFSFQADFSAGVRISFHGVGFGIGLHGSLSGPSPFHMDARVCVTILFWDACLPVSLTFGRSKRVDLPPIDPYTGKPDLQVVGLGSAITDPANWSGSFPAGAHPVVTLTQRASSQKAPIDPVGQATLQQKVCPLNFKLSRFGAYKPTGHTIFNLHSVQVDDGSPPPLRESKRQVVADQFAPAQFKDMKGAESLSSQSYVKLDAGFTIDPDNVVLGDIPSHQVTYDTDVVGNQNDVTSTTNDFTLTLRHLLAMLERSASARGGIRLSGADRFFDATKPILVLLLDEGFVVADSCSLVQATDITGTPVPQVVAQILLDLHLLVAPEDQGRFQVVPSYMAA